MKSLKIALCGCLCAIVAGAASAGFVKDTFENMTPPAQAINGRTSGGGTWGATATTVVMTNKPSGGASGSIGVMIPISQSVSNVPGIATEEKKIWTDFYTIPRPFVSTSQTTPDIDTNATAQFFVSNGYWAAISGVTGTLVRTYTNDWSGTNITANNDGSTWHHVSVFHDYDNGKWALLVNGGTVTKTNMGFINTNVTAYSWFCVANGGGEATNVAWLDDVTITNRVPETLTRDDDADGMYDAWELMYFGTVTSTNTGSGDLDNDGFSNSQESYLLLDGNNSGEVPTAQMVEEAAFNSTNAGFVSASNSVGNDVILAFQVGSNRIYKVLGSTAHNASFTLISGAQVNTTASGPTNWTHSGILGSSSDYYYKLVAQTENGMVVDTNDQIYAVHVQARATTPAYYWTGITVDYGASNKLESTLGQQLANGLQAGNPGGGDTLTVYYPDQSVFYLASGSVWTHLSGSLQVNSNIPVGVAILIEKKSGGGVRSVFAGPMLTASSGVQVPVATNWNMISCPYEGSNSISTLTCGVGSDDIRSADRVWIYRNGAYTQLRRWAAGWEFEPKRTNSLSSTTEGYLRLGEGVFYYKAGEGTGSTWNP